MKGPKSDIGMSQTTNAPKKSPISALGTKPQAVRVRSGGGSAVVGLTSAGSLSAVWGRLRGTFHLISSPDPDKQAR